MSQISLNLVKDNTQQGKSEEEVHPAIYSPGLCVQYARHADTPPAGVPPVCPGVLLLGPARAGGPV